MSVAKSWNEAEKGPALWLDGGDSLASETSQDLLADRAIVDVMESLGYRASNVGARDIPPFYGPFRDLFERSSLPLLSANVRYHDTGERIFPPYRIIEVPSGDSAGGAPLRIGVTGVADAAGTLGTGPKGRTSVVTDPAAELKKILPELRQHCDLLVVLAAGRMQSFPGLLPSGGSQPDILVVAASEPVWPEPRTIGPTLVLVGGDRGREVLHIAVRRGPGDQGFRFEAEKLQLLTETTPEDPTTRDIVEHLTTRLNEESRALMKQVAASPKPSLLPFVGVVRCAGCHENAYATWSRSAHSHAFETLAKRQRDYTRECVTCHVTAFESEAGGGFHDPVTTPELIGVQCEVCHGPGDEHTRNPSAPYGTVDTPTVCQGCHNRERSPGFDFDAYWPKIAH